MILIEILPLEKSKYFDILYIEDINDRKR